MMAVVLALALSAGTVGTSPAGSVHGIGSWYRWHAHQAAAGPSLRKALGRNWRGKWVNVTAHGRTIRVKLTDWCACGHGRVIDLDRASFAALAPPSVGVLRVTVSWGEAIALPETDVAPRRTHGWWLLS